MTRALLRGLAGLALVAGLSATAHAEARLLQVCQALLGDETSCEAVTVWTVDKVATTPTLAAPSATRAAYTVTVTEGETRYDLGVTSVLTMTGLLPAGTRVKGLVASIQKGDGLGHFTTVASAGFGDTSDTCACPFVDSGELAVTIRSLQGEIIPTVEGSVLEFLGYGEDVRVKIGASYDLSNAIIRPGDPVRIQTCVNYAAGDDPEDTACVSDGGEVRSVKACTPFEFDSYATPSLEAVTLGEQLGVPTDGLVRADGFMATPASDTIAPQGPRAVDSGGPALSWSVAPTGVPGTASVIEVEGTLTCQLVDACSRIDGTRCLGTLDNSVELVASGQDPLTASASIDFSCPRAACTPGETNDCDDQNPCTEDGCDPVAGCTHTPREGSCQDGSLCTYNDTCVAGECVGTARRCEDDNGCTADRCDALLGCLHEPVDGGSCDDASACTTGERCVQGACVGTPTTCPEDGNPCTAESCDPQLGCQSAPTAGPCSDGTACTVGDSCVAGVCKPGAALPCADDGNPCTAEVCDAVLGCQHQPLSGVACDDGDACSVYDVCLDGLCKAGPTLRCEDGQSCTDDTCNPVTGCVFTPRGNGLTCDDGTGCTTNDRCEAGPCRGEGLRCDDDNPCTDDLCDLTEGCHHVPNVAPCDDGDACTSGDECRLGMCIGGSSLSCDDGDECTSDLCDRVIGCRHDAAPDGTMCDSQSECTGCPWAETDVALGYEVYPAHREVSLTAAPADYVLWFAGLFGQGYQVRMTGRDGLHLLIRTDGSAVMRGPVYVFDGGGSVPSHTEWSLVLELTARGEGAIGQGSGGPHRELPTGQQGFEFTDLWRYWNISNGMLTTDDPGEWIYLQERPAGGVFPFQMGERANNRNLAFGASAWFTFYRHLPNGTVTSGSGDMNVELTPVFCRGRDQCHGGVCQLGEEQAQCTGIAPRDYCTYTQMAYGTPCPVGENKPSSCLVKDHFAELATNVVWCASGLKGLTLGFTEGDRRLDFTSAQQIVDVLPAMGPGLGDNPSRLRCTPQLSALAEFTGELLALKLNVKLSDLGVTPAAHGLPLGDLVVVSGACAGFSVRSVLQRGETLYAGRTKPSGTTCRLLSELSVAVRDLNRNFEGCAVNLGKVAPP